MAEVGWAGTSVVAVAARAGVSRGAAQHHFATRDALVRAAVESTVQGLRGLLQADAIEGAPGSGDPHVVLQRLVGMWASPTGRAATHLWVAASTEPALRELVLSLAAPFNRELFAVSAELLGADPTDPQARAAVRLTIDLARGIGLGALLDEEGSGRRDLAQWSAVLAALPGLGAQARAT